MTSEEFHAALQRERFRRDPVENDNRRLRAAMTALLCGDVGRQTLAKLTEGQGTDTDDGRAWLHAAAIVTPNAEFRGQAASSRSSHGTTG